MTMQDRQDIFSKEYLDLNDIQMLFGLSKTQASTLLNKMKTKITVGLGRKLRWEYQGKIHVLDYLVWADAANYSDRYAMRTEQQETKGA